MKRPVDIISKSKHSLVHIGSLDSFDLTEGGIGAAKNIMKFFETQDKACLEESVKAYDRLIPAENFGGEYTALRWICNLLLAPSPEQASSFMDEPTVASWYEFLKENDYEKLKVYLNYKYHFKPLSLETDEGRETGRMLRFLEDFILFSNPDRERWEKTRSILKKLRIEKDLVIADVGCGSGYFTFKFADMVGEYGKIYGIEVNPLHLDYLRKYVKKHNIRNVEIVEGASGSIGLDPGVQVDLAFSCSLFHVLYAVFGEEERRPFLESIYNAIKPGGALIVMDNDLVEEGNLPYHGPYIAKDLLISQLHHYGFKLLKKVQETKQRYALVFRKSGVPAQITDDRTNPAKGLITATSGVSLVKFALAGADPGAEYTENGRRAAGLFLRALEEKSAGSIDEAIADYEKFIPTERIGDEYTAFVWFCEYLKADQQGRDLMVSDLPAKEYHDYFAGNDYALLKEYLIKRYELERGHDGTTPSASRTPLPRGELDGGSDGTTSGADAPELRMKNGELRVGDGVTGVSLDSMDDMMQIKEYLAFNNPARERWEKTSQMLDLIDVRPGETVADVGCGSGFFTYKFANLVGESGKVFATELNKAALSYVEKMRDCYDLNIEPVISTLDDVNLPPNRCDKIFMCSMYHAVYVASIEFVKDAYIDSIKKALKSEGKLIVVDNDIKREGVPEYYGSAIDRRLIISQLTHYGFKLLDEKQLIPQRYVLIFQKGLGVRG